MQKLLSSVCRWLIKAPRFSIPTIIHRYNSGCTIQPKVTKTLFYKLPKFVPSLFVSVVSGV